MAIISVGKDNTFGHPRPEIIKRLQDLDITIRRTDQEGTIDISW
jgi:beta-lactamase superfamily II metal-dependent hydrolase